MKFGKSLRRLADSQWSAWYMDYKMLKQLIKACALSGAVAAENVKNNAQSPMDACKLTGVNRMRFFLSIKQEAAKVSTLYTNTLNDWQQEYENIKMHLLTAQRMNIAPSLTLITQFTSLCTVLDRLRSFVLVNHLAFMKILKKYDKKAMLGGYAPVRETCMDTLQLSPFYASNRLANYLAEAECLAASLTNITHHKFMNNSSMVGGNGKAPKVDADAFKCGICLSVLRAPVVLICSHRFCWTCLAHAHKSQLHPACPVCRKEQSLDPNTYKVHPVLEMFVQLHWPNEFIDSDQNGHDKGSISSKSQHNAGVTDELRILTPQKLLSISRAQGNQIYQGNTLPVPQQGSQNGSNEMQIQNNESVISTRSNSTDSGNEDNMMVESNTQEESANDASTVSKSVTVNLPDVQVDSLDSDSPLDQDDPNDSMLGPGANHPNGPGPVRVQPRVARLSRFADLLTFAATPGSFVALDIDETIHTCPHRPCMMMSERGLKAYQVILTSSPLYKDMPFSAKNRCTRVLQAALASKALVEPGNDVNDEERLSTAEVIAALQRSGVFVFGLTARYAAQSAITRKELMSVGVDLTLCTPFPAGCVLRDESTDALYEDGVIFTNACEKGPVLDRFLARLFAAHKSFTQTPPAKIIFVDDRLSNCVSVARSLTVAADLNVPVTAYHYTYAVTGADVSTTPNEEEQHSEVFDAAIVQCQIHHFLHTQQILIDDQAKDMIIKYKQQQQQKLQNQNNPNASQETSNEANNQNEGASVNNPNQQNEQQIQQDKQVEEQAKMKKSSNKRNNPGNYVSSTQQVNSSSSRIQMNGTPLSQYLQNNNGNNSINNLNGVGVGVTVGPGRNNQCNLA